MSEEQHEQRELNSWSLLIDGSALFFGQRQISFTKNMNYPRLKGILQGESNCKALPKPAFFFTTVDESNVGQAKFHSMVRGLGWNVRHTSLQEASIENPLLVKQCSGVVRFDSIISYCLGTLRQQKDLDHIMVVSDSWSLQEPILDCVQKGMVVSLAFFGEVLDSRWWRLIRKAERDNQPFYFTDLDLYYQDLFDRPRPDRSESEVKFSDLP